MKKKICFMICILIVIFFSRQSNINAYANSNSFGNIIAEVGSLNDEMLEIDGYRYIDKNINLQMPGEYTLKYVNLNNGDSLYKKLILYSPDTYLLKSNLVINSYPNLINSSRVIDLCNQGDYTFVIYEDNRLVCYLNGLKKWEDTFENYTDVRLCDLDISENGILVYFSFKNPDISDLAVAEYDRSGDKLREVVLQGSAEDTPFNMQVINGDIYITGETYSKDGDFTGFYPISDANQAFIARIEYNSFEVYDNFGYGNRGVNKLIDAIYLDDQIVLKVQFSNVGPYSYGEDLPEKTALFVMDYRCGLNEVGYETYARYNLTGNELIVPMQENYGLIEDNGTYFSLYQTGQYQTLTGRLTTLVPEYSGYTFKEYELINYYNDFDFVCYFTNGVDDVYKVYKIEDKAFYEAFRGEGKYIKKDGNYWEENFGIKEIIQLKTSELKKTNTNNGIVEVRKYEINNEVIKVSKNELEDKNYGRHNNTGYWIKDNDIYFVNIYENFDCKCNIENDKVYDLNLELIFNGTGYLNNKKIESGYVISEVGRHILIVESTTKERKEFVFEVKSLSIDNIQLDSPIMKNDTLISKNKSDQIVIDVKDNAEMVSTNKGDFNFILFAVLAVVGIILGVIFHKIKEKATGFYGVLILLAIPMCINIKTNAATFEVLTVPSSEEVIDQVNDYKIILQEDDYYLKVDDEYHLIEGANPKIESKDNKIYLSYIKNEKLYLSIIEDDKSLKLDKSISLFDNTILHEYEIKVDNNFIYLIFNINSFTDERFKEIKINKPYLDMECGVVAKINLQGEVVAINIFGGSKNDNITSVVVEKNILIVGTRDKQSGGDFGNAGTKKSSTFIALINSDLELVEYRIIDKKFDIFNVTICKDYYVQLDSEVYIYDNNLTFKKRYQCSSDKIIISSNQVIYSFTNNQIMKIDVQNNLYSIVEVENTNVEEIKFMNDSYFVIMNDSYKYLNILDFENVKYENIYDANKEYFFDAYDLFGKITPTVECKIHFDSMISGKYTYDIVYDLAEFGKINKTATLKVLDEINICEGRIYPAGYRILFKGIARLDGEIIANNYLLKNPGNYTLSIENVNGEVKNIKFTVSENQMNFTERLNKFDDAYFVDEEIIYSFALNIPNEAEIESIIVDGENFNDFTINKEEAFRLDLAFNNLPIGNYIKEVDGFYYSLNEMTYFYPLNEIICFSLYGKELDVKFIAIERDSLDDELVAEYVISDYDRIIRNLMCEVFSGDDTMTKKLPLGSLKISEMNLSNITKISFYLTCDNKGDDEYVKLCDVEFSKTQSQDVLGEIVVNENENGKIILKIIMNKNVSNEIDKFYVNDVLKYNELTTVKNTSIIFSIVVFTVCFLSTVVILKFKS